MHISVFELFKIGLGPSSSHTVGPMLVGNKFAKLLESSELLKKVARIEAELFGSLALTGRGHGTDKAILLGLEGYLPDTIDTDIVDPRFNEINTQHQLLLNHQHLIKFTPNTDLLFHFNKLLPQHTNGIRVSAYDDQQQLLLRKIYYSVGGGFIIEEGENQQKSKQTAVPYPFNNCETLLSLCRQHKLTIAEIMRANELVMHSDAQIKEKLDVIIKTMQDCIHKSCQKTGKLPGRLLVKRRAKLIFDQLNAEGKPDDYKSSSSLNWLNLFAIAVNEANAAGDRIVTAPTNGAAGIIPAVLTYYLQFHKGASREKAHEFLLTAAAIASLYKKNASISGAEVGCQGEVGVASSMAAGALTAVLGGTIEQVENAAEIAMEHHLGMTCDPIAGLVQIPCIERNAMGSVKAVNAANLALLGDGDHYVSLDNVIATMLRTGKDMMTIYKETSQGGLAVNVPEC